MATAESAGKTCVVCGQDVSGKPRVKDAAGKYMCAGECQQKAVAAAKARQDARPATPGAAAQAKPPMAPGGLLGQLIDDSPMLKSAKCESCGSAMPGGAVVCTRCGFNTQTGKALKTAVIVEKEKKQPTASGKYSNKYASSEIGPPFWKMLLVETIVLSAVACLPLLGAEGFLASWVILVVASLLAWIGGTVAAFKNDQTLWGVCGCLLIIPIINFFAYLGFLAYNLLFNEDKFSRALYLSVLIAQVVWIAVIAIAIASGSKFDLMGYGMG